MGLATWIVTHWGWPEYSCCWVSSQPAIEMNTEFPIWNHCPRWSTRVLVVCWLHWTPSIMEEAAFCSYWNRHSLGMNLPSLYSVCLPELSSMDLQNAMFTVKVFYTHYFWSRNSLYIKKLCWHSWNLLVLSYSPPSWRNWIDGTVECSFENTVQHQLGGNTMQILGKVLQKTAYVLNQYPIYDLVFPLCRIHLFRNQVVEIRVNYSPLPLVSH